MDSDFTSRGAAGTFMLYILDVSSTHISEQREKSFTGFSYVKYKKLLRRWFLKKVREPQFLALNADFSPVPEIKITKEKGTECWMITFFFFFFF